MPGTISPATGLVKNANSTWLNGRPLAARSRSGARPAGAPCQRRQLLCPVAKRSTARRRAVGTVFGVILGTGVGGGIVVDGRLLAGANAIAGEWGHNPLPWPRPDELPGPPCYCGRSAASRRFCRARAGRRPSPPYRGRTELRPRSPRGAERGDARLPRDAWTATSTGSPAASPRSSTCSIPTRSSSAAGCRRSARSIDEVPRRWGRYVFSDGVETRLLAAAARRFERRARRGLAVAGGAREMTTLCRDCSRLYARPAARSAAARNAPRRGSSATPSSPTSRSRMSIATPSTPRSRSATGRSSPSGR